MKISKKKWLIIIFLNLKRPERLYDKVESDLIISAIDFNYKKRLKNLRY